MSYFNSLTLTTKGQEMLLSSNTNIDKKITFTNASLGSEKLLPEEIKGAIEIKESWLKFPLNTVRIINDESNYFLRSEIAFTNAGITENKIMRELGIYAKFENEKEVLFAYSTTDDDGETIPKEDIVPATYKFTIDTTISTETKINQTLSPEGFLTKEVIELLKESIRNIAFRKIQGTLTANQKVIQVPTDILLPISERAILNIEGDIYFLERDYTISTHANTITLNDRYNFKEGSKYEIIDPLPATYVKEQIQEFIDDFKKLVSDSKIEFSKLVSDSKIEFEKMKDEISLEIDKKLEEVYKEFDEYIEQNKENLKGHSVDRVVENGQDENRGNKYKLIRDDGKDIGEFVAPAGIDGEDGKQGERGLGIVDWVSGDNSTLENPTARLVLEDGSKTPTEIPIPRGPKGEGFKIAKTYPSVAEMEADFDTDEVLYGEYVFISSNDNDNAKLFEKTTERFEFIVQMGLNGKDGAGVVDKEFVKKDDEGNYIYRDIYSDGRRSSEYISPIGPRGYTGGTVGEPQPPEGVQYGTIVEGIWAEVPSGWMYTNGGTLDKKRYPHMSFLPGTTQPQEPYFKIDGRTPLTDKGEVAGQPTWEFSLGELEGKLYQDFLNVSYTGLYFDSFLRNEGKYGGTGLSFYGMTNAYYYIELPEKLALSYISMNKTNATGNSTTTSGVVNKNVDVYFDIEYMDDNGDWIKGAELHNKTDFIPPSESSGSSIAMIKSSFKSNKFRIIINNKSLQNNTHAGINIYYIGEVAFGFDKGGAQYNDYIQLPNEKDNQGRYKLIYVGQPLEIQEPTMYSYNIDNIHNGEVPLSL
ncbi:MAG: hypothetical protein ACRC7E_06335, partial [Cetobacterium sp.]